MQQHNMPTNIIQRLTRISKNGTLLWHKYYDYSANPNVDNNMQLLGFEKTSDKGFVAAIEVINASPNPFFIVKFDSTFCDSTPGYCATVGLDERVKGNDRIEIYPNPANDVLNVEQLSEYKFGIENCRVQLLNSMGQIVREEELEFAGEKAQINIRNLPEGFYILHFKTKDNFSVNKAFVIER